MSVSIYDKLADVRVRSIFIELARLYPSPKPELNFTNPYETLVAAMLSAQCTDKRVNMVTAQLFQEFPNAADLARSDIETLEDRIHSVGLYHSKAKNLIGTAQAIVNGHGGQVPDTLEALTALPGVGRKVANVVLANAFGKPAFAVDTHVHRLANRLDLAKSKTPEQTERQICRLLPEELWFDAHHQLILHGRRVCRARNPDCGGCTLAAHCRGVDSIDNGINNAINSKE